MFIDQRKDAPKLLGFGAAGIRVVDAAPELVNSEAGNIGGQTQRAAGGQPEVDGTTESKLAGEGTQISASSAPPVRRVTELRLQRLLDFFSEF